MTQQIDDDKSECKVTIKIQILYFLDIDQVQLNGWASDFRAILSQPYYNGKYLDTYLSNFYYHNPAAINIRYENGKKEAESSQPITHYITDFNRPKL